MSTPVSYTHLRQAELDRKKFEDAKRKAQMEAELRAMKEAEEKAQAKAHQQKLAKEQEEKQNVLAPIKDYVEKAENGDGQAACQIGLWLSLIHISRRSERLDCPCFIYVKCLSASRTTVHLADSTSCVVNVGI